VKAVRCAEHLLVSSSPTARRSRNQRLIFDVGSASAKNRTMMKVLLRLCRLRTVIIAKVMTAAGRRSPDRPGRTRANAENSKKQGSLPGQGRPHRSPSLRKSSRNSIADHSGVLREPDLTFALEVASFRNALESMLGSISQASEIPVDDFGYGSSHQHAPADSTARVLESDVTEAVRRLEGCSTRGPRI